MPVSLEQIDFEPYTATVMNHVGEGVALVDGQGKLLYLNEALGEICGVELPGEAWVGRSWLSLFSDNQRRELEDDILPEFYETGTYSSGFSVMRHNGEVASVSLSLYKVEGGGFAVIMRDMTASEEADREKEILQEQFYQSQKMEAIGRLAGGVAHDFNNILAAMNGYAEFLVEDLPADSLEKGYADNIIQAGRQARDLVDQILAFSRRRPTDAQDMDLLNSVRESLNMLRASLPKSIELSTYFDLDSAPVRANPSQISQVIMNLCVNACDAMENQRGELFITLYEASRDLCAGLDISSTALPDMDETPSIRIEDVGPGSTRLFLGSLVEGETYFCLKIRDTGSGMSRRVMEHVFEPFFTTKPVEKGTGLGLATVHGVVASHRGAMIIQSTVEEGTAFEIFFPALVGNTAQDNAPQPGKTDQPEKKTGHILFVEDQKEVREMTASMLRRMGYDVCTATTGLEALEHLKDTQRPFDLVLTDHNMPKMTGLELALQAEYDFPDLPFILLSGYSEEELKALMYDHPAIKAILRKPISRHDLCTELEKVLSL